MTKDLEYFINESLNKDDLINRLESREVTEEELLEIKKAPELESKIIAVLKTVYDPEISINIYDLGLIYDILLEKDILNINMTLTAPTCPVAGIIPLKVKAQLERFIADFSEIKVNLVWSPPWDKSKMSDDAKLMLDLW